MFVSDRLWSFVDYALPLKLSNRQFVRSTTVALSRSHHKNYIRYANTDRKSTRLNSSHVRTSRMPSSA